MYLGGALGAGLVGCPRAVGALGCAAVAIISNTEVPFVFGTAAGNAGRFVVPAALFAILGIAARANFDGDFASSSASVTRKL